MTCDLAVAGQEGTEAIMEIIGQTEEYLKKYEISKESAAEFFQKYSLDETYQELLKKKVIAKCPEAVGK